MLDQSAEEAWECWLSEFDKWKNGERDRVAAKYGESDYPADQPYRAFVSWYGPPPDPNYYRPAWVKEEPTAYQVYETVTKGTPISPVFPTRVELVDWLVNDGSRMGLGGMPYRMTAEQAERFVGSGCSVSMVVTPGEGVTSGLDVFGKGV